MCNIDIRGILCICIWEDSYNIHECVVYGVIFTGIYSRRMKDYVSCYWEPAVSAELLKLVLGKCVPKDVVHATNNNLEFRLTHYLLNYYIVSFYSC